MFTKVLIANRGEIACRIIAALRESGIRSVAVYSEADRDCLHVRLADEAVCIGPPAARDSYLNIANLISAAKLTGAQAIHPGYGFLSENAEFAQACADAGLVFVWPTAAMMTAMGSKSDSKMLMEKAGVPLVPCGCSQKTGTVRRALRDMFAELEVQYPHLKENILSAMGNIDTGRLLDTRFLKLDAAGEEDEGAALIPIVTEP